MSAIELTYTGRERSFVTWSAILGYAFDALFLPETAGRKFAVIEGKEHG